MKVTKVGTKESRKPCCGRGCSQRDSAEHEGYAEALTDKRIIGNNNFDVDSGGNKLMERILSRENLNRAYKQAKKNKGAHGVDGMEDTVLTYACLSEKGLIYLPLKGNKFACSVPAYLTSTTVF